MVGGRSCRLLPVLGSGHMQGGAHEASVVLLAIVASLIIASTALCQPRLGRRWCHGGTIAIVSPTVRPTRRGAARSTAASTSTRSRLAASSLAWSTSRSSPVGDVGGGSPRLAVPVDTTGDGSAKVLRLLSADRCGAVSDATKTISTNDPGCIVDVNTGGTYDNWDAFVARTRSLVSPPATRSSSS